MSACKGRHHDWTTKAAGGACRKCKTPWKPAGRPKGSTTKLRAGEAVAQRMAATLGIAAPPAGSPPTPLGPVQEAGPMAATELAAAGPAASGGSPSPAPADEQKAPGEYPEPSPLMARVAKRATKLFDTLTDAALEMIDKEDGEADPDDLADFEKALASQLTVWFPNAALSPAKQLLLSGGFIVGEKWMTAKTVERQPAREAITAARPAELVEPVSGAPAVTSTSPPNLRPV